MSKGPWALAVARISFFVNAGAGTLVDKAVLVDERGGTRTANAELVRLRDDWKDLLKLDLSSRRAAGGHSPNGEEGSRTERRRSQTERRQSLTRVSAVWRVDGQSYV